MLAHRITSNDDTPHQAEPHPQSGFIIVMDPQRIFRRGLSFEQFDFAMSLYYGAWPVGLVVRDLSDNWYYRVVEDTRRCVTGEMYYRQALLRIDEAVILTIPNNNGALKARRIAK